MNKNFGKMVTAILIMGFLLSVTIRVDAAEYNPGGNRPSRLSVFSNGRNESCYFDAVTYAMMYPDLGMLYGNDRKKLWTHYKTVGVFEGRTAFATTNDANAKLRIFDVAYTITNDAMSDRDKVRAVHDWIINNTVYDYQNYLNNSIPPASYEVEGVMLNGIGVCSGYAKTFDYFMHVLGIGHEYVTGMGYTSEGGGPHAWNCVLIDGNRLYLDCTWDDPVCIGGGPVLNYDYFLVPYEQISLDHLVQESYRLF